MLDMGPLQARNAPLTKRGFLFAVVHHHDVALQGANILLLSPASAGLHFLYAHKGSVSSPAGAPLCRGVVAGGEASREGRRMASFRRSASTGAAGKMKALPAGDSVPGTHSKTVRSAVASSRP